MAANVGHSRSVAAFTQVHQVLGQAHKTIGAAVQQAEQAINQTKAIEDG